MKWIRSKKREPVSEKHWSWAITNLKYGSTWAISNNSNRTTRKLKSIIKNQYKKIRIVQARKDYSKLKTS